ncbi:formimidoylglutamase [Haloferax sp. DFSO60]|uniref:formimidoylglutamase n=1 Tax=Haloferax sp. DFSO60 TaxID=3388652 RepID=UPI00397BED51
MMFEDTYDWHGPSSDPNDEQIGDIVSPATLDTGDDFDAVLVGEPYDGAVIGRKGAREGPEAIRTALEAVKSHHFDAGPLSNLGDLGNVTFDADADVSVVQDAVTEATREVYTNAHFPVFLGGDNSLTVANVRPLLDRDASVGVVSFDAHLDCREPTDGPSSGTPYHQLFDEGLDRLAVVGARHFETSTAYAEFISEQGGVIFTAKEVGRDSDQTIDFALDSLTGCDYIFVSLDIDVLDETAAPGVSAPTPGGITTRELFSMLRRVASDPRVVGFEVVECAPPLDQDGRTVRAAARAIAHALSGVTERV